MIVNQHEDYLRWQNGRETGGRGGSEPGAATTKRNNLINQVKGAAGFGANYLADNVMAPAMRGNGNRGGGVGGSNANQPYIDQLNSLYDQIMGRGPFRYDLNGDLLYRQMADQYTQLGYQAMRDATGAAAGLTGGYGNSYANQVGNQAYQQYLTQLNATIPEYYDRAYNAWLNEGDQLMQQYQLAMAHPQALASLKPASGGGTRIPTGEEAGVPNGLGIDDMTNELYWMMQGKYGDGAKGGADVNDGGYNALASSILAGVNGPLSRTNITNPPPAGTSGNGAVSLDDIANLNLTTGLPFTSYQQGGGGGGSKDDKKKKK